jgi:F0F1-type ATP synthase delta subunit
MAERSDAYAAAFLAVISAEDTLGEVEDELFRFARILEGNDELLETLSDPRIEPARRQQVVTDLLDGKAQPWWLWWSPTAGPVSSPRSSTP